MAHGDDNPSTDYCTDEMTSNTAPSPNVVSDNFSSAQSWYCFDRVITREYYKNSTANKWVKFNFGSGITKLVNKYAIVSNRTSNSRWPASIQLQGSNDDSDWTTLDTRTGVAFPGQQVWTSYFTFENSTAYQYYRMNFAYVPTTSELAITQIKLVEVEIAPPTSDITLPLFQLAI